MSETITSEHDDMVMMSLLEACPKIRYKGKIHLKIGDVKGLCKNYIKALREKDARFLSQKRGYKGNLVDINEFLESPYYMNQKGSVRPKIQEELNNIFAADDTYIEVCLCLQGDTKIPLLDGTAPTIKELADKKADDFWGLSLKDGEPYPVKAYNAKCYGIDRIYRVCFSDGTHIEANGAHKLFMNNGKSVRVDELKEGDSLLGGNHKVARVEITDRQEPVYCLTVPETSSFLIGVQQPGAA